MKKYKFFTAVSALLFILLGFNVNYASAIAGRYSDVPGCNDSPTQAYSTTTGQPCGNAVTVFECKAGDLFSSVTGAPCTGVQSDTSDVSTFNALFKNSFTVGLRGSAEVRALQQFLKEQGYYFGKIDGAYGRITERAVRDFRDDNSLTITINPTYPYPTPPTATTIPSINLISKNISTNGAYVMEYDMTFDGTRYDPSALTLSLYCTAGVIAYDANNEKGQDVCSKGSGTSVDMNRINDGLYQKIITFTNGTSQTQTILAMAQFFGGSRVNPVATDKDAFGLPPTNTTSSFPPGCTSNQGFSNTTGAPCYPTTPSTLPDLIISDVSCNPSSPKGLEMMSCDVTVYNNSAVAANTQFSVNIQGSLAYIDSLPAYSRRTVSTPHPFGLSIPGPVEANFTVDSDNKVSESNNENNDYKKVINVQPTFTGEGVLKLYHWATLQLNNGLILYADGGNVLGATPYKVSFKVYDSRNNYNLVTTTDDIYIGQSKTITIDQRTITVRVNSIDVQSSGNANWTADITASSLGGSSPFPPGCTSNQGFSSTTGASCGNSTTPAVISVSSPTPGYNYKVGDNAVVNWTITGAIPNSWPTDGGVPQVVIDLYSSGGNFIQHLSTLHGGSYTFWFTVPNVTAGNYEVRVWAPNNLPYLGQSGTFSIAASSTQPSVSLNIDTSTPVSASLSNGQTSVDLAHVFLSTSGGDVLLSQVSVGVNPATSGNLVSNIRVYDGATLLGSIPTLSNQNVNAYHNEAWGSASFYPITIPSNSSKVLTIKADIAQTGSGSFKAGVVGLGYTSPAQNGNNWINVYGNQMTVASSSANVWTNDGSYGADIGTFKYLSWALSRNSSSLFQGKTTSHPVNVPSVKSGYTIDGESIVNYYATNFQFASSLDASSFLSGYVSDVDSSSYGRAGNVYKISDPNSMGLIWKSGANILFIHANLNSPQGTSWLDRAFDVYSLKFGPSGN